MNSWTSAFGRARLLPSRNNVYAFAALILAICTAIPTANARGVLDKLDDAIAQMANYRSGDSPEALELVYNLAVKAQESDAARRALSVRLCGLLDSSATIEAKIFACKQLNLIGGDESVPVLARALANPDLTEVALYALDGIRTPEADRALRSALAVAPPKLSVSLINSLAERRDAFSVNTLAGLVYKRDDKIAEAAIQALGRIGNEEAARAIARARVGAPEPRFHQLTEALIMAAGRLEAAGNSQTAIAFYQQLYGSAGSPSVKLAAFRGLAEALGRDASPVIRDALTSDAREIAATACDFVATAQGNAEATASYCSLLPTLDGDVQALLIDALAERGDSTAAPAVRKLTQPSTPLAVRRAALNAVAQLGSANDVALLQEAAADTETADVAADALTTLSGPDVADAIVQAASTGSLDRRLPLVKALGARAEPATLPGLLQFAKDANPQIRAAAYDACVAVADAQNVPVLASLLLDESDGDARAAAERALVAVSKHAPEYAAGELFAHLKQAKESDAQYQSLLRVLATTEQPVALDALKDAAKSRDDAIQLTAIQALSNWPNDDPLSILENHAAGRKNNPVRAAAFRGYIQLLRLPSDRSTKETVKHYQKARKLAETTDDKKLLLAGLAEVPDREALKLAEKLSHDKDVAEEAALAIQQIEKGSYSAIASNDAADADKAFDNNERSRWTTGTVQRPGQWFQLDLGRTCTISGIKLDAANSGQDYPRGYELYLSNDGERWGDPVAQGQGGAAVMTITFKPHKTRYVKIVQTGEADSYFWSIHEIAAIE